MLLIYLPIIVFISPPRPPPPVNNPSEGGADLSGILTLDDEDDFDDFARDIVQDSASASTVFSASPIRPSVSFLDEAGRNLARGDALAREQQTAESEEWDSDDGEGGGDGAGGGGGGTDGASRTVGRGGVAGGFRSGRFGALGRVGGAGGPGNPTGEGERRASKKVGNGSPGNNCSNPNMSSPTRPAEEGSDWDGDGGESSDDVESDTGTDSGRGEALPSNRVGRRGSRLTEGVAGGLDESAGSDGGGKPFVGLSPFRSSENSSDAAESKSATKGDVVGRRSGPDQARGSRSSSRSGEDSRRVTPPVASGTSGEREVVEMAAVATTEATIEALQAELKSLRDHVLRSDRRKEAQLRQLDARLEAQERRDGSPQGRVESARVRLKEPSERDAGASGAEGAIEARRSGHKDDAGTPHGAGFHNPFAGTGGGAATPRDHFPAFEDALHDGGDEDVESEEDIGGERGGEQVDKSLCQSEAFDFSIETLSHINNHTDFGTDTPTRALLPAAAPATSPNIGLQGKARGKPDRGSQPWEMIASTPSLGGGLEAEEGDEPFDAKDTALEEAFFGDACATASLQTPVKHVLATAAAYNAGVATRKVKLDGRRSARGTPAERPSVESSAPAGARPYVYHNGEQSHHQLRRTPGARGGVQPFRRSAASEEDAVPDPNRASSDLCMADFFARASAELDKSSGDGSGQAWGPTPTARGAETPGKRSASFRGSKVENRRSGGGVDAETQTAWSFTAHENVRLVSASAPEKTLARASMEGQNVFRQRLDGGNWSGRRGSVENSGALSPPGFCAAYAGDGAEEATGQERVLSCHPNTSDGELIGVDVMTYFDA